MMTLLRKHRGWLMIVITVLALPFCLYFVKTDYSRIRQDAFATAYGRTITMVEAQRNARLFSLARELGMDSLVQGLAGTGNDQNQAATAFAINLIVLQHESEALGIQPTAAELGDFIRNLRGFRGPNGYDPKKYQEFAENILPANGFSGAQIEELATYALSLNKIKDMVTAGLTVPELESNSNFEQAHGKLFVHAVHFRSADYAKDVKITDEDVQKYFEAHKAELKTDEKRKVSFVRLGANDEEKKLTGKERVEVLQKLGDKAGEFKQALDEKGTTFEQVAAKFQLPVKTTAEFTAAAPDPQLKDWPQLSMTAFQLTKEDPDSEPVDTQDGYYVLHLLDVTESKPLTLEEAKSKITDSIKTTRTKEQAMAKARQASEDLRNNLKSGTALQAALDKAKVKAETIPPFTLMEAFDPSAGDKEKNNPKDFMLIKNAAAQAQPGEVSQILPTDDGALFVYVEKREPPDAAKVAAEKPAFDERVLRNKRMLVFSEWLRDRERDAGFISSTPQSEAPAQGAPTAPTPPGKKS